MNIYQVSSTLTSRNCKSLKSRVDFPRQNGNKAELSSRTETRFINTNLSDEELNRQIRKRDFAKPKKSGEIPSKGTRRNGRLLILYEHSENS